MQEEISKSAGQKFICEVCKKPFKAITNTHLKKHGITEAEYKERFPHSQMGDFYIPDYNLIAEIDGDFWHANPSKFSASDAVGPKKLRAQEIWDRDLSKKNKLESAGFAVIRYWASELENITSQKVFEDIVQSSGKLEVPS